jgi:hypothetical protein
VNSHIRPKFKARPPRILASLSIHQFKRNVLVVDDNHRLSEDCNGAERSITLFVLQPVLVLWDSWWRQVVYVGEKWEAFGT